MLNQPTLKSAPAVQLNKHSGESRRVSRPFVNKVEKLNEALYLALNGQFEVKF